MSPPDGGPPPLVCDPGTYRALDAAGPVCRACETGHFSKEKNADGCLEWTTCEPGEFVEVTGNAISDRQCAPCADGETSTTENAGACTLPGECAAGTQALEDETCEECSPGTYCAGGDSAPVECEASTWDDDGHPATPCVAKSGCPVGTYITDPGSTTKNRACKTCSSGTFTTKSNRESCTAWSDCAVGTYVSVAGNTTRDRSCTECVDGFSDTENQKECQAWATCEAPSEYETDTPSNERDRQCDLCPGSTVTSEDNQTECSDPAFQMVDGEVVIEAENYTDLDDRGEAAGWTELADAAISGGLGMVIGTEASGFWTDDPAANAPRLDYRVNFTSTGTFYLFIRGDSGAAAGASDSCFGGLDDVATDIYLYNTATNVWGWQRQPIDVTAAGIHTVSVFAREDGFRVDKLVVRTEDTAPTDNGPDESAFE